MSIEPDSPLLAIWDGNGTDSSTVLVDFEKNLVFGIPTGFTGTSLTLLTQDGDGDWVVHKQDGTDVVLTLAANESHSTETFAAAFAAAVSFRLRSSATEPADTTVHITGK